MADNQQELAFEARPLAHAAGSESEHRAAEEMVTSGALKGHERLIVDGLRLYPNRTAAELAKYITLGMEQIDRRVSAMAAKGLITKVTQRRCRVRGSLMNTWRVKG